MPVPKRRHQRESPSGELNRPEVSPEPKRRQRETTSLGFPVTQGQPSTAVISDPSFTSPVASQVVRLDSSRHIYEDMSSKKKTSLEAPGNGEGSPPHAQDIDGHAPLGGSHQLPDGTATQPRQNRIEGMDLTSSASPGGSIGDLLPFPSPPVRSPPAPPLVEPANVGNDTLPLQGSSSESSLPTLLAAPSPVEDFALWGGLSDAEIRRQKSMLEAFERRRRVSLSPSPGPISPSLISPLTSPPLSPPLPPGSSPITQAERRSIRQSSMYTPVMSTPPPGFSRLGPPPLPPSSESRELPSGPQQPRSRHAIRPEIVSASSVTRHSDRVSSSEGPRPRRGAMSIHFDDSDITESEARRLFATMRGSPNQASVNLIRDLEVARTTGASFLQQGSGTTLLDSTSDDNIGSLQRYMPQAAVKKFPVISSKGKQRQDPDRSPDPTETRPKIRHIRRLREIHDPHAATTPGRLSHFAQDSTFRFSASKGYYEAVVPISYVMNNPNTRPLSTTDPFFRCFPSDPDEIHFFQGTRLGTRPPTPEIHLDETLEQKKEHLKQVKKVQRKQDWTSRKDIPLSRTWHLQYSTRSRAIPSREPTLASFPGGKIFVNDLADEAEFQAHLARIKKDYYKKARAELEADAGNSILGYIPISELAIDPLVSSRSRRTAQPEEAQPLEVGREPEHVQEPPSEARPSSSKNVPDDAGESSQGKKKESRRRK
ncbi:hypothetical protein TWF506_002079 [Arthrobotrys conoides]|uniref:Uncharacterized protein n=1 Tax=Arthrobotrys conoides TaxID=74498 RepID=A0AAN8P408_9PEZI